MLQSNKPLAAMLILATALGVSACTRVPGHQGFIADKPLVDGIQAGIDNRESVQKTLGRDRKSVV